MDLDVLFQAATGLEIEDFLAIAWMHAAPLYRPRSPQDLAAAGFHTVLAGLQHRYRDPDTAAAAAALLIGDVATMRERFARDTADLHRSSLRPFWELLHGAVGRSPAPSCRPCVNSHRVLPTWDSGRATA